MHVNSEDGEIPDHSVEVLSEVELREEDGSRYLRSERSSHLIH